MKKENVRFLPVDTTSIHHGPPQEIEENLNIIKEFKNNNLFDFTFPKFFVPYPDSDIYLHPEKYDVTIKKRKLE